MDARHSQNTVGRGNVMSKAMRSGTAAASPTDTALVEENAVNQAETLDETSSENLDSETESTSSEGSSLSAKDEDDDDDDDESLSNGGIASSSRQPEPQTGPGTDDIKSRLAAFLPAMKKANANLAHAERIDDVREGEQYVEMNLGLGVLEEQTKRPGDLLHEVTSSDDSSNTSSEEENEKDDEEKITFPSAKRRKIGIEEVE